MKALILNFRSFEGKKETSKGKFFYTFDMYDIKKKVLYKIFQDAGATLLPDGEVPSSEEVEKSFPRIADLETRVEQFAGSDGRPAFRFYVDAIESWKFADLDQLV